MEVSAAGVVDTAEMQTRHTEANALVHRFIDEQTLFPEALQLAVDLDHPACDAIYAVAARRHAATVLTFDCRLHALCVQAAIGCELFGT